MAEYELREGEASYSHEAIQALNLQTESHHLGNTYKLHESCALHLTLLDHDDLPALWRSILNMSMASLDPKCWKEYLERAVCAWKETGREPGDRLWEEMRAKLKKLAKVVEERNGVRLDSRRSSEESSGRSSMEGSNGYDVAEDEAGGETDADVIVMAFKLLGM